MGKIIRFGRLAIALGIALLATAPAAARAEEQKPAPAVDQKTATTTSTAQQQQQRTPPADITHAKQPTCPPDRASNRSDSLPETRNGTAMVGIAACWDADEDNEDFNDLSDYYAHWSVRELRFEGPIPREYARESHSALIRLFVGHDLSMVGSLRIDMHDPDTTFIVPLANFSYQGRVGKGQYWSTNLVSDDQSLGFFRIGPTSSANIIVSAKSTSALQVQAASTVLGVLRDLSGLASPGGALVTTLNRNAIQQTSRTLDNALSSIWGQSREESHTTSRQISEWYPGARFIIQLSIADFVKGKPEDKGGPSRTLTRWYELTLSCPRRSIFSAVVECPGHAGRAGRNLADAQTVLGALAGRISAQQVLEAKVGGGVSLQQYVGNHDWYTRFLRIGDDEPGNGAQQTTDKGAPTGGTSLSEADKASAIQPVAAEGTAESDPSKQGGALATATTATPPTPPSQTKGTTHRTESDYAALCGSIVNTLYSIGFSRLDAQIGLWAIIGGSSDFVGLEAKFQANPRCTALLPLAGTTSAGRWSFAAAAIRAGDQGKGKGKGTTRPPK